MNVRNELTFSGLFVLVVLVVVVVLGIGLAKGREGKGPTGGNQRQQ
jgi:ABC-type transporter Mla subunit MlaD